MLKVTLLQISSNCTRSPNFFWRHLMNQTVFGMRDSREFNHIRRWICHPVHGMHAQNTLQNIVISGLSSLKHTQDIIQLLTQEMTDLTFICACTCTCGYVYTLAWLAFFNKLPSDNYSMHLAPDLTPGRLKEWWRVRNIRKRGREVERKNLHLPFPLPQMTLPFYRTPEC